MIYLYRPLDVMSPNEPVQGFLINFIPDKSYISSSLKSFDEASRYR